MRFNIMVFSLALVGTHASPLAAEKLPLWEAGIGAFGMTLPDYRGSDQSSGYVYPFPYIRYRGELLRMDDRRGLAALRLLDTDRAELNLSLNASQPARSDSDNARHGMPDLDPTGAADQAVGEHRPRERTDAATSSARGFRARRAQSRLHRRRVQPGDRLVHARRWTRRRLAIRCASRTAFHHPTLQRIPAYEASGGYSGTQFTLSLNKRFNSIWVSTFVRAYDLHGTTFDDSPLLKQRYAVLAGVGLAYVFAESKTRVEAED